MPDREDVIKRLRIMSVYFKSMMAVGYHGDMEIYQRQRETINMAIELLKEQETELCDRCGRRRVKSDREVK